MDSRNPRRPPPVSQGLGGRRPRDRASICRWRSARRRPPRRREFVPNAFLRIAPDNTVTVISKHIEFGQGPYTGIATILADELDADWSQIRVESAPADVTRYANSRLRRAGHRRLDRHGQLLGAAPQGRRRSARAPRSRPRPRHGASTPARSRSRRASSSIHRASRRRSASSRSRAQSSRSSAEPKPKEPGDWRLIGKHVPQVDTVPKTNGTAMFTIDVKLPDMADLPHRASRRASARRPRRSIRPPALAVPGVKEVVRRAARRRRSGRRLLGARKKARDALKITWDETGTEARSSRDLVKSYTRARARRRARSRATTATPRRRSRAPPR